jgi:RNA polymerase sigma-70 factor (ECF subfamily)
LRIAGRGIDDLAHQAAADAVGALTAKLGQFRVESRFTTWAYKFVMFEVSTKSSRHRPQRRPLDALVAELGSNRNAIYKIDVRCRA